MTDDTREPTPSDAPMLPEGEALGGLPVTDLPVLDPGLPRFAVLAAVVIAVASFWLVARPTDVAPLETVVIEDDLEVVAAPGDETGGMLFVREGCGACHATDGPSTALGPTLLDAAQNAVDRIRSSDYTGRAEDERAYLREATLDHCVDVLPGYQCVEVSEVALRLSSSQVERLVDFMMALGEEVAP